MKTDFSELFKEALDPMTSLDASNANGIARDVARSLVAGLGVGAAGAGLVQLGKMWNRGQEKDKSPYPAVLTTPMPFPAMPKVAFAKTVARHGFKAVSRRLKNKKRGKKAEDLNVYKEAEGVLDAILPHYQAGQEAPAYLNQGVSNPQSSPAYWPGVAMMAGAGLYGGYKGVRGIFDHFDNKEKDQEVNDARQQFEQALLASYPKPKTTVAPGMGQKLGEALDAIYDSIGSEKAAEFVEGVEKQATDRAGLSMGAAAAQLNGATPFASGDRLGKLLERTKLRDENKKDHEGGGSWMSAFGFGGDKNAAVDDSWGQWAKDLWGQGRGLYGAYALGTGIPAALATYNAVRSSGQDNTMDSVLQAHHRQQYAQSPTQIMAVPHPVFPEQPRPDRYQRMRQRRDPDSVESDPMDMAVAA